MQKLKYQDLSCFSLPPNFRGRSAFAVQLWWLVQATLFALSPQFMYGWRRFILRLFGAKIGKGVLVRPSVKITYPWKVFIGDYSWIGDDVVLYSLDYIYIGDNVVISQGSYLCTGSHDLRSHNFKITRSSITIDSEAWLASQVFVFPGVKIGVGAVIGVRALVTSNIEPGSIAYGAPALVHGLR